MKAVGIRDGRVVDNFNDADEVVQAEDLEEVYEGASIVRRDADSNPVFDITDFVVFEERRAAEWSKIRETRNAYLLDSDWTQLADVGLTEEKIKEWKAYRVLLRDLPDDSANPLTVEWPTQPS
tara:strand:- start:1658 stop:2026 length:369 start_codon:yes stop_codon:yes gene_type:complete